MDSENQDTPLTPPKQNKWVRIGGHFLASVFLIAVGATGFWAYQTKITNRPTSPKDVSKDKRSVESPLNIWERFVDKQHPEFNSVSIFYNKDGDSNFYFLYKGKVYFDELKESYHLDVLKKEGWRQIMNSNDSNDFELFDIKSGYREKIFFVTNCREETCSPSSPKGYKVFHYEWAQPYYENNPPVEIYTSDKDESYPVPKVDKNSKDGDYLSLLLYQCWACGGHDPKTVLINDYPSML
ncbi:hypothetical protein KJ953_02565 [Patescibacteria group bacterium]|nr:hypothetical protein [Patescibacteria group bacterium]